MLGLARRARVDGHGHQVIQVDVRDGYHPSRIEARAGLPLRIVFDRHDADPCSERVVFSEPRVERRLSPNAPTEVILPVPRAGTVRFTCGMGRYRGTIVVRPGPAHPAHGAIRRALASPLDTLGLAAGLWLCSLPLLVLVAVLFMDPPAVIPLALLTLVAWAVGCLLAARLSRRLAPPPHLEVPHDQP